MVLMLWRAVLWYLVKVTIFLPHNSAIALLGIYTKELKTSVYTNTYTWIFTAALFISVKTWKQMRCPSVGEWINKL